MSKAKKQRKNSFFSRSDFKKAQHLSTSAPEKELCNKRMEGESKKVAK